MATSIGPVWLARQLIGRGKGGDQHTHVWLMHFMATVTNNASWRGKKIVARDNLNHNPKGTAFARNNCNKITTKHKYTCKFSKFLLKTKLFSMEICVFYETVDRAAHMQHFESSTPEINGVGRWQWLSACLHPVNNVCKQDLLGLGTQPNTEELL